MPTTNAICVDCDNHCIDYELIGGAAVCYPCRDENYNECSGCGIVLHCDDLSYCDHDNYYCPDCSCNCYPDDDDNTPFRPTDEHTDEYIGRRHGRIVKSLRPFGVEIECYLQDESKEAMLDELPPAVGMGADGSLGNDGLEIRTPRLAGAKGEALIRHITNRLERHEARVNRSCGLHIHLDTSDIHDAEHLRHLWALYLAFEDVLLSLLPPSRRSNYYCKALRRYFHTEEILECPTREKLEAIWYRARDSEEVRKLKIIKSHDSRYIGLNLHSLFHANHAEIRYHSGTVNAEKILQWVNLHALLFDKAESKEARVVIEDGLAEVYLERKNKLLFDFLGLSPTACQYLLKRQALFANSSSKS